MAEKLAEAIASKILCDALSLPTSLEGDPLVRMARRVDEGVSVDMPECLLSMWAEVRALRIVMHYTYPLLERMSGTMSAIDDTLSALFDDQTQIVAGVNGIAVAIGDTTNEMGTLIGALLASEKLSGEGSQNLVKLQNLHTALSAVPDQLKSFATTLEASVASVQEQAAAAAAEPDPAPPVTPPLTGQATGAGSAPAAPSPTNTGADLTKEPDAGDATGGEGAGADAAAAKDKDGEGGE